MWVPQHFERGEAGWDAEVIGQHPFGLLVTGGTGAVAPVATHIPMLLHPEDRVAAREGLVGQRILGHLARLNPHWEQITDGDPVLTIFQGPQGYISPTTYADEPAAPTWNYVAVHASGPIRLIHDPQDMMRVIDLTIDATEAGRHSPWDREPSRSYFERIIRGVVAFEVRVTSVAASYKVSQDQPDQRRRDVIAEAEGSADEGRRSMGTWVRRAAPDL